MSWKIVAAVLLLTTSPISAPLTVPPNEPPAVDAGLDQDVYVGTTVLLDAGGTRDPDGTITSYEWRIRTPAGANGTPRCATCERTRFRPAQNGTYAVTLTATDDDGATRSDTLYVTVRADDGPTVSLDGPRRATLGTQVTFEATPTAGTEPLVDLDWRIDGTPVPNRDTTTLERTVTRPGERTITVTVTDAIGRTANATRTIEVSSETNSPNGDRSGDENNGTDEPAAPVFEPGDGSSNSTNQTTPSNDSNSPSSGPSNSSNRIPDDTKSANDPTGPAPNSSNDSTGDSDPSNPSENSTTPAPGSGSNSTDTTDDSKSGSDETDRISPGNDGTDTRNEADSTDPSVSTPIGDRTDPTVVGPQLVTGNEPLDAMYRVRTTTGMENVSSIEWFANGDRVGDSSSLRATWTPGDHALKASITYRDGSAETAIFPDGTTTVTADPAPDPELGSPNVTGRDVTGPFEVVDEYGNLQNTTVTIGDRTLFDATFPTIVSRGERTVSNTYASKELPPNTTLRVTLTATDARGQTRTTTRTIRTKNDTDKTDETTNQSTNTPKIIQAGFLQDTVDSYHPRIASYRYTAEHVVRIDLNSYPASKVEITNLGKEKSMKSLSNKKTEYNKKTDILTISSFWAGSKPKKYNLTTVVNFESINEKEYIRSFEVTPSPPELRLTSPDEGTKMRVSDWGMVVDARRSFDPDGTQLSIDWLQGARALADQPFMAKLDPYELAGVRVTDESGAEAEELGSFLPYYLPRVKQVVEMSEGPYNESESVVLELRTQSYAFTKNEERYNISLGARTNSSAVRISSVSKENVPPSELSKYNAIKHRVHRWVVRLRVRASALNDSEHWVTVFNEENPERTYVNRELGDVELRVSNEKRDVSVAEMTYEVRNESGKERRRVSDRRTQKRLRDAGWKVKETMDTVDSITIETRASRETDETESRRFQSLIPALKFTEMHQSWTYEGVERSNETETEVITRWTQNLSVGLPTLKTRRVVSNPDAERKERKYRYFITKEVEKEQTIPDQIPTAGPRVPSISPTCNRIIGCQEAPEHGPSSKTEIGEEPAQRPISETKRVPRNYWAQTARHESHIFTGETRTVRTEPRDYETEYQVMIPVEKTVTKERYVASREVTKTEEIWKNTSTVSSLFQARKMTAVSDKRIGNIRKHPEWVLVKNKTVTEIVKTYDDEEEVETTHATVSGVLVSGLESDDTQPFEIHIEISGVATKEDVLEVAMNRTLACDDDSEKCHA